MRRAGNGARACDLCGSTGQTRRYRFRDIDVLKCTDCGLVFVQMRNGREVVPRDIYDPAYFDERGEYFLQPPDPGVPAMTGSHIDSFRDGLDRIARYKNGGKLLDLGCAVGVFLALARDRGWDVRGVDISEYAVSQARRLFGDRVFSGDLADMAFPEGSFDVITLWDSVEHFPSPSETLREAHRILKPGGLILMDTPNEDALVRKAAYGIYRLLGGRVAYPAGKLYHSYHLYYFSEKTLTAMLDKCGFEVVEASRRSIPQEKGRGSRVERALVKAFAALEEPLGMAFELLVLARRIP